MPTLQTLACYFFGPFLRDELTRVRFQAARSSNEEVRVARLSYPRIASLLTLSLPKDLTISAPRSERKQDGSFELPFERKLFGEMWAKMYGPDATPAGKRLAESVEKEDYRLMWHTLFAENFGVGYEMLATYRELIANLSTVAAGIELVLYQLWEQEGRALLESASRIHDELDITELSRLATKTGVSFGIVLAAVSQLGAKKEASKVRSSLEKGNWDDLHAALWEPFLPDYRTHPTFALFLQKLQDPTIKPVGGRPPRLIAPQPPAADTKTDGLLFPLPASGLAHKPSGKFDKKENL